MKMSVIVFQVDDDRVCPEAFDIDLQGTYGGTATTLVEIRFEV